MILPLKLFAKQVVIQVCPLLQNVKNLVSFLLWDLKVIDSIPYVCG